MRASGKFAAALMALPFAALTVFGQTVAIGGPARCTVPCPPPAPVCPAPATGPTAPTTPTTPTEPPAAQPPAAQEPAADPLAFGATGGGESFASAAPQMIGNFAGAFSYITVGNPTAGGSISIPLGQFGLPGQSAGVNFTATVQQTFRIPLPVNGSFAITENESPRPMDRVFCTFNFFDHAGTGGSAGGPAAPIGSAVIGPNTLSNFTGFGLSAQTQATLSALPAGNSAATVLNGLNTVLQSFNGLPPALRDSLTRQILSSNVLPTQLANQARALVTNNPNISASAAMQAMTAINILSTTGFPAGTVIALTGPGSPTIAPAGVAVVNGSVNYFRETIGFEKQFFNGNASIGMRLPFNEYGGTGALLNVGGIGDLTIIGKYALYNNRQTGSVISAGMALTLPTGANVTLPSGNNFNPTILQPFVGGIWARDRFYAQGFSSLPVPFDPLDPMVWFNDMGVGYYAVRRDAGILRFVTPTLETHVVTPVTHLNNDSLIYVPNIVAFTEGVHFGIGQRSLLTVGIAEPITGPRPFHTEVFTQLNYRW